MRCRGRGVKQRKTGTEGHHIEKDQKSRYERPLLNRLENLSNGNTSHRKQGGGFRNPWGPERDVPVAKMLGWMLGRILRGTNALPAAAVLPDAGLAVRGTPSPRITWIGHSTVYLRAPDLNVLTDPQFSVRASPVPWAGPRRMADLVVGIEDLPALDLVIISHDHYDHLDKSSIERIERRFSPVYLVPLGVGAILRQWGVERVVEMDWWQAMSLGDYEVHCTPAKHFSGRGLTNRDGALWCGWYLKSVQNTVRIYFAGDTAYAPFFDEIRRRIGPPEIALLPVGAYEPRWFMQEVHMNPEEAFQSFQELRAQYFIPIHWGTFDMADDALTAGADRASELAGASGNGDRFLRLAPGETIAIEPAGPVRMSSPKKEVA